MNERAGEEEMNEGPRFRLTFANIGIAATLLISAGTGIWNTAVQSNQIATVREDVRELKAREKESRDQDEKTAADIAAINAKLDILLDDRRRK